MAVFAGVAVNVKILRYVVGNEALPMRLLARARRVRVDYHAVDGNKCDLYTWEVSGQAYNLCARLEENESYDPGLAQDEDHSFPKAHSTVDREKRKDGTYNLRADLFKLVYTCAEPGNKFRDDVLQRYPSLAEDASRSPVWKLELIFEKALNLNYPAWINQQRAILQEFFFPWDYRDREVRHTFRCRGRVSPSPPFPFFFLGPRSGLFPFVP
jgi:hypothetical protein